MTDLLVVATAVNTDGATTANAVITVAAATGFPNASTTGVRSGVTLTNYTGPATITTAGTVITAKNITGFITIRAPNVRLTDCKVTGSVVCASQNTIIEFCDVIGQSSVNCIEINPDGKLTQGDNTNVRSCDISGAENGIWLEGDGCTIEESYIHNLFSNTGASDPHIDGIQIPAAFPGTTRTQNCMIRHNNLDMINQTASSSITLRDADNIDFINNRLSGGAAILRIEGTSTGCDVIGNTFGQFVFVRIDDQTSGANRGTYSGNIDEATGLPVPAP